MTRPFECIRVPDHDAPLSAPEALRVIGENVLTGYRGAMLMGPWLCNAAQDLRIRGAITTETEDFIVARIQEQLPDGATILTQWRDPEARGMFALLLADVIESET